MELREAIKQLLKEIGQTQQWLSEQLGYSSRSVLQSTLARGNITLNTLLHICEKLNAKLVIKRGDSEVELVRKEKR